MQFRHIIVLFFLCFAQTHTQSVTTEAKINSKELKCLVCQKSVHELEVAVSRLDPNKKVDVGGHRLDEKGNYKHKAVSQAKSELVLSEIVEQVCEKMDNYVRALWKSNGSLTLLSMVGDDGNINPSWTDMDIVQDDDLNKSLKYYCEEIMEVYEEDLIGLFQKQSADLGDAFCVRNSKLCQDKNSKQEL